MSHPVPFAALLRTCSDVTRPATPRRRSVVIDYLPAVPRPHRLAASLARAGWCSALAVALLMPGGPANGGADAVAFRRADGVPLTAASAGDPGGLQAEALWRQAIELPRGARLLLGLSAAEAPADGRSRVEVVLRMVDAEGREPAADAPPLRVRLSTTLGRFEVPGVPVRERALGPEDVTHTELQSLEIVFTGGELRLPLLSPMAPGEALVQAASGAAGVQGGIHFVPDLQPMKVVGLLEGAIDFRRVRKASADAPDVDLGFEAELRHWQGELAGGRSSGRLALYAKGAIDGRTLLTAAADSDKDTRKRLFRDIDPDAYYPVYGDASLRQQDARSASHAYVRVDRDRSYVLWGDFTTDSGGIGGMGGSGSSAADDGPRLAAVQRQLTGARWHLDGEPLTLDAWGAYDRLRHLVDEQPGRGISGPYALGQPNAVAGTERIELLVRDRNAPSIVLSRRLLARFGDYDFEPFSGRVMFRQPVPSVDADGNPVSVRIGYEVDEGGPRFLVAGVDAGLRLSDGLRLGASLAEDRNPLAPQRLAGVRARWQLAEHGVLMAEFAQSQGALSANMPLATPLPGPSADPGPEARGRAAMLEWRHEDEGFQARAYAARSGPGFVNPASGLPPGRDEAGARLGMVLTDDLRLDADLVHTADHSGTATDGARRTGVSVGAGLRLGERLQLDVGLRHVDERQPQGSAGVLSPLQAQATTRPGLGWNNNTGFGFDGGGLLGSPAALPGLTPGGTPPPLVDHAYTSLRARLTGHITDRLSALAEVERAVDGTDRQRLAVGADYRLDHRSRAYLRHEFADSLSNTYGLTADGSRQRRTSVGVDTRVAGEGQLFTEYRLAGTQNGQDAAAAIGLRNPWRLAEGLQASTTIELQSVRTAATALRPAQQRSARAYGLAADYTAQPDYKLGGKLEYRDSSAQDAWLASLAATRRLNDDWAALVRELVLRQSARGEAAAAGTQLQHRLQLGLAWRDTVRNRWHALGRIEHRIDRSDAAAAPLDTRTLVGSLHANWQPAARFTYSGQLAWKQVDERLPAASAGAGRWQGTLVGARMTWDLSDRFDAGLYGSLQRDAHARLTGIGADLGVRVADNLWLSVGYTSGRYADVDAFAANTTLRGWVLRLRAKFDEDLFGAGKPRPYNPPPPETRPAD